MDSLYLSRRSFKALKTDMTEQQFLEYFENRTGKTPRVNAKGEAMLPCPCHDDQKPSLSINAKKRVFYCFSCNTGGGITQFEMLLRKCDRATARGEVRQWFGSRSGETESSPRKIVATYDYTDEHGAILKQVVRYSPKSFSQRKPDGKGGWDWSVQGVRDVLYRLPEMLAEKSLLICEGEKDCEAARALGIVATCNSGGAGKWREEYSEGLRGKQIIIIADADDPGRKHAQQVAASLTGKVESLKLLELPGSKDLSEWVGRGGTRPALLELIASATEWKPQAVDVAAMLDSIVVFVRRFVSLSPSQARVIALWIVHTHAIDAAHATPYLAITSAEKQSGKTRLLEVCNLLVANPWMTGRVTAAVLYRTIDKDHPTLLLDESDAAFGGEKEYAEALRGILNTGYTPSGAASCCVGQGAAISVKNFSTFCPKAIAGIGKLPETIADRSILICLKRTKRGERVERFRRRDVEPEAAPLREAISRWCAAAEQTLRDARPELPDELSDRQQDGAEPLLAIAGMAGGEWPKSARQALAELCAEAQAADESIGVRLLADIRGIFKDRDADRISSAELAAALAEIETSPWGEWGKAGKPLTAAKLARQLGRYGIIPISIRVGEKTPKGYLLSDFQDAFGRYLPAVDASTAPDSLSQSATPQQTNTVGPECRFSKCNTASDVAARKHEIANKTGPNCGVAVSNPPTGAREGEIEGEDEVRL
jgi:hypothetical protein